MSKLREKAIAHLRTVLEAYQVLPSQDSDYGQPSRSDDVIKTRLQQAIDRWAPSDSAYHQTGNSTDGSYEPTDRWGKACTALLADIEAGYVDTLEEEVHASTNSDLLGIAESILQTNKMLPAAVVMGVLLEQHLRELCRKHQIPIERTMPDGTVKRLTGSELNVKLKAEGVYNASKHDVISGLLKIRNSAAHGNEEELVESDVRAMLPDVRRFLDEYPA